MVIEIQKSNLVDLLGGRLIEIEVGTIPHEVRLYLGSSKDTVFLTKFSIKHIFDSHVDHIDIDELLVLPTVLTKGLWLSDKKRNFAIATCEVGQNRYKAAVKSTIARDRIFVSTFHRLAKRQTKALMRRGQILRPAW